MSSTFIASSARFSQRKGRVGRSARVFVLSMLAALLVITAMPWSAAGASVTETGTTTDGGGGNAWTNPGNAATNNNQYATRSLNQNQTSNTLWAKSMGFAIPSDATITGIQVRIGRESSGSSSPLIRDFVVQLTKDGSAFVGDNKAITATNWPQDEAEQAYGGAADLWGQTWTPAEINAATFGVGLQARNTNSNPRTASVDYMSITVAYTQPGGPNGAQTAVNDNSAGTTAWSNPGNVATDDSTYATANLNQSSTSQYLNATNFGFSVPAEATINGVTVVVNRLGSSTTGGGIRDHTIQLIKGGARTGDNKAVTGTNWPTTTGGANATYGSTSDTWGTTLTPADVNASNFGVSVRVSNANTGTNRTASVDYIEITVDYDLDPRVTVEQAAGQNDPTNVASIDFDVEFNKDVTGVEAEDFVVGGSATGFAVDSVNGSGSSYSVTVTGTVDATDGTVSLSMPAGGAQDSGARTNRASTSADNAVTYDGTKPTVTVEQAAGQDDPTIVASMDFDVEFDEPVTGLEADDFVVGGSATGFAVDSVSGSGASYSVTVTGTVGAADGTVTLSLPADAAEDGAGNGNEASTSTDNSVTYDTTANAVTGLYVAAYAPSYVGIAWNAATDVSGVAGYLVSRTGSSEVATITGTEYLFDGLDQDTSYTFTVRTIDVLDNISSPTTIAKKTPATSFSSDVTTDSPTADLMLPEGKVTVTIGGMTKNGTFYLTPEPSPPAGWQSGSTYVRLGSMSYEVTFNGEFDGDVTITMPYSPLLPDSRAAAIKIRHRDGMMWETITPTVDLVNHTITFKLSSLSPLVVVEPASASKNLSLTTNFGGQKSSVRTFKPARGAAVTLVATLRDAGGKGVANKKVNIERYTGSSWVKVAQASSTAKGVYSYKTSANSKMIYRFVVDADAYTNKATGLSYTLYPKVKLSITKAPTSAKVGKSFTIKGKLTPKHKAGTKLTLKFYKYSKGKYVYQYAKTVKVKTSGSSSVFSNKFTIKKAGTWRVRIYAKTDSLHSASYSAYKKIKVKK